MGRYLKKYDKENMRMAMLKQEETFRHQVHELHRLYQVQRVLVNDMKAEIKRQRKSPNYSSQDLRRPSRSLNLELPAEEYIGKDDRDMTLDVDEDNELELTLATGSKSRRKKDNSFTSDSGASFSSSSGESGSKVKLNGNEWGVYPDMNMDSYQRGRKSVYDVEEQMREERMKQPPWLLHCLSLNMT